MRVPRIIARLLVVALLWLPAGPAAQAGTVTPVWSHEVGATLTDVAVGADGRHVYVTGTIWAPSSRPGGDHRWAVVLAKFRADGALEWRRSWLPAQEDRNASGQSVTAAPSGGVYVGGATTWYEDAYPQIWRYSSAGRLLWRSPLPYSIQSGSVPSLAADEAGVVAAVQSAGCCDEVRHDGVLVALDPAGTHSWRTDFEVPGIAGTWDGVAGIAIGPGTGIFAAGHVDRTFFDSPDDPAPDEDVVVQRLTRKGHATWTRVIGDGPTTDRDEATAVGARAGLVLVSASIDDGSRGWLGAFGTDGVARWSQRWGRGYLTFPSDLALATWGPLYVTSIWTEFLSGGGMRTTSTLRRYSPDGTLAWTRRLDRYDGPLGASGIATSETAPYLTIVTRVERWPR